jgi:hypothetical protein
MSNARKPPPTVEVVDPIIVRAIKWKRGVGSVDLSYCFRDPEGNTTTGSRFGVDSSLVVADYLADDLLTGFLALAEPRSVTRALRALAEDPKQKPVVLRSGLLASLLQYGHRASGNLDVPAQSRRSTPKGYGAAESVRFARSQDGRPLGRRRKKVRVVG